MPDPDKPYYIEVDASNYATKGILAQPKADEQWYLVAYLSKSLLELKHNYDIHNKELSSHYLGIEILETLFERRLSPGRYYYQSQEPWILHQFAKTKLSSGTMSPIPHPL